MIKNVLITDGTGFLGVHLARKLLEGADNPFIDNENN